MDTTYLVSRMGSKTTRSEDSATEELQSARAEHNSLRIHKALFIDGEKWLRHYQRAQGHKVSYLLHAASFPYLSNTIT